MKDKHFKRPPLRQRRRHIFRQLFNGWPWLIWIGAALAVIVLLPGGLHKVQFHGEAERTYEYVSPLESGRLKTLNVRINDIVHEGMLIGELDNESLASEMVMDQASLLKTRDKIQSIRYDIEGLKMDQARTEADLMALEGEWERTQELLEKKLILEQEAVDLRPRIQAEKRILEHYPDLIQTLEERLALLKKDEELLTGEELKALQEAQCRLVAKSSGVVAEVLHQPGDVVETGDPVARIGNVSTSRVIAFMPEERRMDLVEGQSCRVITSAGRRIYLGTVESISADIRKLPVFTGFADQILRGHRIVIQLDEGYELVPGERVVVVPNSSLIEQWFGRK